MFYIPNCSSMQKYVSKKTDPAFTLIEVTIALGIAAFSIVAVFGALTSGFDTLRDSIDEVVEFHSMSGDIDYLLKIVVPNITAYDAIYKRLIRAASLSNVTANFAMETIKSTTALPVTYAQ